jgi:hypothetical protein
VQEIFLLAQKPSILSPAATRRTVVTCGLTLQEFAVSGGAVSLVTGRGLGCAAFTLSGVRSQQTRSRSDKGMTYVDSIHAEAGAHRPRRHGAKRGFALAVIVLSVFAACGCSDSPPRTAAEFCRVYYQQEHQYLARYDHSSPNEPLQDLGNVVGAMSDWVPIFQALDQVAPPAIEPDVQNIVDALKQEEQAAGNEFSNPLGALASGLETGFMSTASWDNVSRYIQQHCGTGG